MKLFNALLADPLLDTTCSAHRRTLLNNEITCTDRSRMLFFFSKFIFLLPAALQCTVGPQGRSSLFSYRSQAERHWGVSLFLFLSVFLSRMVHKISIARAVGRPLQLCRVNGIGIPSSAGHATLQLTSINIFEICATLLPAKEREIAVRLLVRESIDF